MQYEVDVNGRSRRVVVRRENGRFVVTVDGRDVEVDAIRVGAHTWSLLVGTASFEVTVAPGAEAGQLAVEVGAAPVAVSLNGRRRWGRTDEGASSGGTGPDHLVAAMPGKVVRVLTKVGDQVRPRQALVVIEAMKMENELRATREGIVKDVRVREGQSVDAGAVLVVVDRTGTST